MMLPAAEPRPEHHRLIAKNAMDLFQKIIHVKTPRHPHDHTEKDLVARCIDVLVTCFVKIRRRFYKTTYLTLVPTVPNFFSY